MQFLATKIQSFRLTLFPVSRSSYCCFLFYFIFLLLHIYFCTDKVNSCS